MHSTRERLSSYWSRIKDFLLSPIEEEVGSLTNKKKNTIGILDLILCGGQTTTSLEQVYSCKCIIFIDGSKFEQRSVTAYV